MTFYKGGQPSKPLQQLYRCCQSGSVLDLNRLIVTSPPASGSIKDADTVDNIPDRQWYERVSRDRGVAFHCPFATVEACPRYYQSLSLLGDAGSTQIPASEDRRLLKLWKASDLWPRTAEQATSISGRSGNPSVFMNFCPEIAFERYGYFATSLAKYADEIDFRVAQEKMRREGVHPNHPNLTWALCVGQHFTECPVFAVLCHRSQTGIVEPKEMPEPLWREHIVEIIGTILAALAVAVLSKFL